MKYARMKRYKERKKVKDGWMKGRKRKKKKGLKEEKKIKCMVCVLCRAVKKTERRQCE